jgi:hypothetical protein
VYHFHLNVVSRDRMRQPTTAKAIKPLEFDSVLERGDLVGLSSLHRTAASCHVQVGDVGCFVAGGKARRPTSTLWLSLLGPISGT